MKHSTKHRSIPLYYPNLIGYVRILLGGIAAACFNSYIWPACVFYGVSQVLDAVDGHVARAFNQVSILGAVMDQVTDRMSTLCMYMLLAACYPSWAAGFIFLAVVDIGGHWVFVHAQTLSGASNHKKVPEYPVPVVGPLLTFYYRNKYFMLLCHAAYEACLCGVLIMGKQDVSAFVRKCVLLLLPFASIKVITNAAQIQLGASILVNFENKRHPPHQDH